ncbi:MAG TPA: matrixin family metalloprotease [Planctomycetota bacterium]|nr:matrixin family metalloprotease [Planctomycetota bacterium]
MRLRRLALAAPLAAAFVLASPTFVSGYALLGFLLPLVPNQRDFRVNQASFVDATANNNVTPQVNYPGATGAAMALWKAASEWGAYRHGTNGSGDPSQGAIGGDSGNSVFVDNSLANFDFTYQGVTTTAGGSTGNVVSATQTTLGPGVLAATFLPGGSGAGGWQMLFDDPQWTWDDGPTAGVSGWCIQGIGTHELGHALGLGHTAVGGATMLSGAAPFAVTLRSIEVDDADGIKANYGATSAAKPRITGLSGSFVVGGVLTITGTNFAATGNTVWFTSAAATGTPKTVTGLASTGGGTSIAVTIPTSAPLPVDGDLLVLVPPGTLGANLSNAWPIDISSGPPPTLVSISPDPAPIASQGVTAMTITGTDLATVSSVSIGPATISGAALTASATQVTFNLPSPFSAVNLGPNSVTATNPSGTSNALSLTIDPANPPVLAIPGFTGTGQPFAADTYTAPGNFVILIMSPSNIPSSLPGVVDLGLGAGFSSILMFPTTVAGAAQGKTTTSFTVPGGGAPGTVFYFQSVSIPPSLASPFPSSNMMQTILLF